MRVVVVAIGAALLAFCGVLLWIANRPVRTPPVANTYRVDERSPKIKYLKLKAVEGSGDAAIQLVNLYGHCHKADPPKGELEKCRRAIRYWTEVALENGSTTAIKYQIDDLLGSHSCADAYRAEFWYARLQKLNPNDDIYMKPLAEEVTIAKKSCSW